MGGAQDEARGLLNQIDAERLEQKQAAAAKSFDAAVQAAGRNDHGRALGVLVLIDPKLLPAADRARRDEMMRTCKAAIDRGPAAADVVATAGVQTGPIPRRCRSARRPPLGPGRRAAGRAARARCRPPPPVPRPRSCPPPVVPPTIATGPSIVPMPVAPPALTAGPAIVSPPIDPPGTARVGAPTPAPRTIAADPRSAARRTWPPSRTPCGGSSSRSSGPRG